MRAGVSLLCLGFGRTRGTPNITLWPPTLARDLSAYARQPARGPTMLAHLVAICWPMLASCWPMWSQKIRKMGTAKNAVNAGYFDGRRPILGLCWPILGLCWPILRAMWAHLGAMLAHLGAMLAHLGAMLAHLGAMLAHLGGYVGPSWGLCWPILGAMLAHLGGYVGPSWGLCWPMLTHLEPQRPKKWKKWEGHETP